MRLRMDRLPGMTVSHKKRHVGCHARYNHTAQNRQNDVYSSILCLRPSRNHQNALLIDTTYLGFGLASQRYRWWL